MMIILMKFSINSKYSYKVYHFHILLIAILLFALILYFRESLILLSRSYPELI